MRSPRRSVVIAVGVLLAMSSPFGLAQTKVSSAASKMATSTDAIEKITWYQDKSTPKVPLGKIVYLYMGKQNAAPWLRLKLQWSSSNWMFVEKAIVVVDGEKRGEVGGRWERDHGSGTVWENIDLKVDAGNVGVVKALAQAKTVTVRFEGRKTYDDYKLSAKELQAIKNVLDAFAEMGGKL